MTFNKQNLYWILIGLLLVANLSFLGDNKPVVLPHWSETPIFFHLLK